MNSNLKYNEENSSDFQSIDVKLTKKGKKKVK